MGLARIIEDEGVADDRQRMKTCSARLTIWHRSKPSTAIRPTAGRTFTAWAARFISCSPAIRRSPKGRSPSGLMKHQIEPAREHPQGSPRCAPVAGHICEAMMAKKPDDRYQTAETLPKSLPNGSPTVAGKWAAATSRFASGSSGVGSDVFRRFAPIDPDTAPRRSRASCQEQRNRRQLLPPKPMTPGTTMTKRSAWRRSKRTQEPEDFSVKSKHNRRHFGRQSGRSQRPARLGAGPRKSLVEEAFEIEAAKANTSPSPRHAGQSTIRSTTRILGTKLWYPRPGPSSQVLIGVRRSDRAS